jgi:nitrate reductase assembly molybdenum cofactor insertion protein NarJ
MNATARELLCEAVEWRLLGLLFEYPDEGWRRRMNDLLRDLRDPGFRALAEAALETATPGLYLALFGPGGTVPIRAAAYRGGVQLGYLMAELAAYYEAFAFQPALGEAEDHLAVELGFLAYLKLKRAMAVDSGAEKCATLALSAEESFLREHLAGLAAPILRALEAFAPEYLAQAGLILVQRAGPPAKSDYPLGSVLPDDDDSSTFDCGAGGELVQVSMNGGVSGQ